MNAYELADAIEDWDSDGQWDTPAANMIRQQADKISNMEQWEKRYLDKIAELEDKLSFYEIKDLDSGLKTKPLSDEEHYKNKAEYLDKRELELLTKIRKYEEVLQSIANEQVELSHDKIKWQCEDHIRWAKEALSLSGNNAEYVGNTNETLPKGKE